ncbi:transposase [Fundidesulfovibrio soli]|uniref:transposase n=1 Tax=Fundidesulfovibrio soli TaxID=2922716 RepID=UPI001FAEE79C
MADERKTESLEGYYLQFTKDQLERIKAVAMDMWEPYFKATLKHVPGAAGKIVHDRFHVIKHVGEAVDRVRKQEHRELTGQDDHRLKGTKYLWLYRKANLPDKHRPALEALKAANLKVAKAWAMKESLNDVWKYLSTGWARRFVKRWLTWVNKSGLAPMQKVGGLIQRQLENILTFCRHRITNGVAEGLNSKIMAINQAQGLRLQEPGSFQDRHLLLLRRFGPLPGQLVTGATHRKPGRT